jgi:hypothetical protein
VNYDDVTNLSDDDLLRELTFAEGFGPDIDPAAPGWIEHLRVERERRH